jgi:two-component system, cell cycle sensor histidine kinase and response regulator CckA
MRKSQTSPSDTTAYTSVSSSPRAAVGVAFARANRTLRVLTAFNQALIRSKGETELLDFLCRIVVSTGQYPLAWIGLKGQDECKTVRVAACAGEEAAALRSVDLSWADEDRGRGPVGTAIRSGKPFIINNLPENLAYEPWRRLAASGGYRSAAGFPLIIEGEVVGAVGIASAEQDAFDSEEVRLLSELVDDLAYGIRTLRERDRQAMTQEELRHTSELLSAVFHASPVALLVLDPQGGVQMWNRSAERIFGWTAAEVLNQPLPIVPAEKAEEHLDIRRRVLSGEAVNGIDLERRRKDGSSINVRLFTAPSRDASGRVTAIMSVLADMTEYKRLEEQFLQSQKLESVGRLAGGVAHDFNNLLTVINGYGELVYSALAADDPVRDQVLEIRKAGERAASLTQQLLAFSRRQVLRPKVLDLNNLVTESGNFLRRLIGEHIQLVTRLGPSVSHVLADENQIHQVLMNLVVNARDAMPDGGRLIIETANAVLDEHDASSHRGMKPGRYVLLAVTDTGAGMSEETMSHLFEPFFTTKSLGLGTGLGLSTVYGIVKQSGGSIWVSSEPGKGTCFKIYLPRFVEEGEIDLPQSPLAKASRGTETILVVEDQPDVRALVRRVLEIAGYTVLEASGPHDAMLRSGAYTGPIDLLLTDVAMPGMTGRDLAGILQPSRPKLKVLYMSGYADNVIVHRGVLDPDVNYLQKPFTPELLACRVREMLDS